MSFEEIQQLLASSAKSIEALSNQLTEVAHQATESERRFTQLTESNARAIAALADQTAEMRLEFAELITRLFHMQESATEERQELRQATIGIANLLSSLDEDRPTILRKLNSIENKVDRLLQQDSE
ncbi:MAG: hypothetical protein MUF49_16585 [Oculatellaceae cyanobacterium Prado106]|jgi:TolA-binding protein|nr:hypothetical protein [Oculatellaceae cyanobacterium Prado106]